MKTLKNYSKFLATSGISLLLMSSPGLSFAKDGSLDDISIQVIGLDEIPLDALERIPMPTPNFGSLTDIREGVILNHKEIAIPGADMAAPPSAGQPEQETVGGTN